MVAVMITVIITILLLLLLGTSTATPASSSFCFGSFDHLRWFHCRAQIRPSDFFDPFFPLLLFLLWTLHFPCRLCERESRRKTAEHTDTQSERVTRCFCLTHSLRGVKNFYFFQIDASDLS